MLGDYSNISNNRLQDTKLKMEVIGGTPTKRIKMKMIKKEYSGLKENSFDPDNYDYEAATPKKKLVF